MNLRAHDGHAARDDLNDRGAAMIRLHRATYRWKCIRFGHALICTSLGHVCSRCGCNWERLP